MASLTYESVIGVAVRTVKKGAICALPTLGVPGSVVSTPGEMMVTNYSTNGGSRHLARIANWAITHELDSAEIDRLKSVLGDYPAELVDRELKEELRCILGARQLAGMPELTADEVSRARTAFETGRTSFVVEDVD
jgi:hypothetical protein